MRILRPFDVPVPQLPQSKSRINYTIAIASTNTSYYRSVGRSQQGDPAGRGQHQQRQRHHLPDAADRDAQERAAGQGEGEGQAGIIQSASRIVQIAPEKDVAQELQVEEEQIAQAPSVSLYHLAQHSRGRNFS